MFRAIVTNEAQIRADNVLRGEGGDALKGSLGRAVPPRPSNLVIV